MSRINDFDEQNNFNYRQNNSKNQNISSENNGLNRVQKISVSVLIIFAVVFLFSYFSQFNERIRSPFNLNNTNKNISEEDSNTALSDEERQKNLDNDKDGLSDWDEINIYKTSPYIEDTDSDGINDGEEVKTKQNPNCPVGRQCSVNASQSDANKNNELLNYDAEAPVDETQNSTNPIQKNLLDAQSSASGANKNTDNITAAQLREVLLKQEGINKADLDKLSDETLMKAFNDIKKNNTKK